MQNNSVQKKLTVVLVATVVGVAGGALLAFGPLLKYKSEGVLNIPMGLADYKRIDEFTHNSDVLREFIKLNPPVNMEGEQLERLARILTTSEWSKPVPMLSKLDMKNLPDLQKDESDSKPYLGINLSAISRDPAQAAAVTRWLGAYYKDAATLETLRDLVNRWTVKNTQPLDRILEKKVKAEFAIAQVQSRAAALKQLMARYPNTSIRDSQQILDVRKENEKFMSPLAQLVAAESEIIGLQEDIRKLDREAVQYAFAKTLAEQATQALNASRTGSESTTHLAKVIQQLGQQSKNDAEQEKLLAFAADLSEIQTRFLSRAQFIADPSVPIRPEGLGPLKIMALMGFLAMLISTAWVMRKTLLKLLQEDAEPQRQDLPAAG